MENYLRLLFVRGTEIHAARVDSTELGEGKLPRFIILVDLMLIKQLPLVNEVSLEVLANHTNLFLQLIILDGILPTNLLHVLNGGLCLIDDCLLLLYNLLEVLDLLAKLHVLALEKDYPSFICVDFLLVLGELLVERLIRRLSLGFIFDGFALELLVGSVEFNCLIFELFLEAVHLALELSVLTTKKCKFHLVDVIGCLGNRLHGFFLLWSFFLLFQLFHWLNETCYFVRVDYINPPRLFLLCCLCRIVLRRKVSLSYAARVFDLLTLSITNDKLSRYPTSSSNARWSFHLCPSIICL